MDPNEIIKKYTSVKIPGRHQVNQGEADTLLQKNNESKFVSTENNLFYEIEYDHPIKGVGRFVLKSRKIEPQQNDEIREQFYAMREISRNYRRNYSYTKFYDKRVQQDNALIFYKQGIFMKDFTDNYSENTPLSAYFPNYQMMGHEQLRTYFTWRTNVRAGNIADTSLSYAFLYIYELLNNIGVENPYDGLKKLVYFWKTFREYNNAIDKYIIRWLKDYHIYYELPHSFKDFAEENNLTGYYPSMADANNPFDLFCAVSKYDIRKSAFFSEDNHKLITDCFSFMIEKIRKEFSLKGLHFDNFIFSPTKKMSVWQPFHGALFHEWLKQPDRRIVLSQNEIYICKQNKWVFSTVITSDCGSHLIGYIIKKMESELRNLTKYKFKITANANPVTHTAMEELKKAGLSLENIITSAVMEFYREATKIIVSVDYGLLNKIRQEALSTQEKLCVEQVEDVSVSAVDSGSALAAEDTITPFDKGEPVADNTPYSVQDSVGSNVVGDVAVKDITASAFKNIVASAGKGMTIENKPDLLYDQWESFGNSLDETERHALIILISDKQNIKQFADSHGIMLEVLIDGINEKAIDSIGDNILDEDFNVYDDYMEKLKKMVN